VYDPVSGRFGPLAEQPRHRWREEADSGLGGEGDKGPVDVTM
jgi:hypothetical protein